MTLECLRSIPLSRIRFGVITFEHDAYRSDDSVRKPSRRLLEENGYVRICSDVKLDGREFEDWYYDPEIIDIEKCGFLCSSKKGWEEIVFE